MTEWLRLEWTSGGYLVYPLLKPCHLEQVAQDCVQVAFVGLQGGRPQCLWAIHFSPPSRTIMYCGEMLPEPLVF